MKRRIITLMLSITMCLSLFNMNTGISYSKREIVQISEGYSTEGLDFYDIIQIWNRHHDEKNFRFVSKGGQAKKIINKSDIKKPKY